jgi:DNA-directed RNA polymerase specialized sigma24 family protein
MPSHAWLFQIAINETRMLLRRNARRLCFKSVDETTLTHGHVQRMVSGTERTRGASYEFCPFSRNALTQEWTGVSNRSHAKSPQAAIAGYSPQW